MSQRHNLDIFFPKCISNIILDYCKELLPRNVEDVPIISNTQIVKSDEKIVVELANGEYAVYFNASKINESINHADDEHYYLPLVCHVCFDMLHYHSDSKEKNCDLCSESYNNMTCSKCELPPINCRFCEKKHYVCNECRDDDWSIHDTRCK
jgi:hypothetical protein